MQLLYSILIILTLSIPSTPINLGVVDGGFSCPSNIPEGIGFYVKDSQYNELTCDEIFELTKDNDDLHMHQEYSDYVPIPERKITCYVERFCSG